MEGGPRIVGKLRPRIVSEKIQRAVAGGGREPWVREAKGRV